MFRRILCIIFCIFVVGAEDIKLGMSAVFSGPSQALGNNFYQGANLYLTKVNNNGGINGQRINIVKIDDTYNPVPCIQNTIKLIQDDKVDLLFNYVGTPTTTAILPLLKIHEKEKIQLFGNFTGAGGQRTPPYKQYVWNIRASYKQETEKLVQFFLSQGMRKIGIYYQIDGYGRSGYDGVKQELSKQQLKIAAEATYRRGMKYDSSATAQAQHLKRNSVDAVICVGSYQACAAFVRDARKEELNVPIANISFVGTEAMIDILKKDSVSLKNLYFSEVVPYYGETDYPLIQEYISEVKQAGLEPNFISLEGFVNAKVLVAIFRQYPDKKISRKNIHNLIPNMKPIDIGIKTDLKFSLENHQLLNYVYIYKAKNDGTLTKAE